MNTWVNTMSKSIIFYPDYSGGNPYQKLLYKPATDVGYDVISGTISDALKLPYDLSRAIFHIHWLNAVFSMCESAKVAWNAAGELIDGIALFQAKGGKVIWTIHNHLPHENLFPEQDLRLRHFLCASADRIHLHCGSHVNELSYLPLDIGKVFVYRHGSYSDYYGKFSLKDRFERFDINQPKAVFIGSLRRYKNIDQLLFIASELIRNGVDVTIAGKPENEKLRNRMESQCNALGINHTLRRLTDAEIHELCMRSDIGILSYDRILTSGTLKLYFSYGMQILAPELSTIVAEDRFNSFVYYSSSDDTIDFEYQKLKLNEYHQCFQYSYYIAQESRWCPGLFEFN